MATFDDVQSELGIGIGDPHCAVAGNKRGSSVRSDPLQEPVLPPDAAGVPHSPALGEPARQPVDQKGATRTYILGRGTPELVSWVAAANRPAAEGGMNVRHRPTAASTAGKWSYRSCPNRPASLASCQVAKLDAYRDTPT